jgi:hypothetical protein
MFRLTSTAVRSDAKAGIFVSGAGITGGRLMARLLERGGLESRANSRPADHLSAIEAR